MVAALAPRVARLAVVVAPLVVVPRLVTALAVVATGLVAPLAMVVARLAMPHALAAGVGRLPVLVVGLALSLAAARLAVLVALAIDRSELVCLGADTLAEGLAMLVVARGLHPLRCGRDRVGQLVPTLRQPFGGVRDAVAEGDVRVVTAALDDRRGSGGIVLTAGPGGILVRLGDLGDAGAEVLAAAATGREVRTLQVGKSDAGQAGGQGQGGSAAERMSNAVVHRRILLPKADSEEGFAQTTA